MSKILLVIISIAIVGAALTGLVFSDTFPFKGASMQTGRSAFGLENAPIAPVTMPAIPEQNNDTTFIPISRETADVVPDAGRTSQSAEPSKVLNAVCTDAQKDTFECYEKHYAMLIATQGIPAAFDDIKARYKEDSYVVAQCHPLTHSIGRVAAQQFATVGEAYRYGDGYCWSGYYHGVLESFLDDIGLENLAVDIDHVCENIPGKERYSFDYYNCVHGLGHGVMAITNDKLFDSLGLCDNLTGGWEQMSCASGAFMENIIIDGLNHKTEYLRPDDPLYPCTESPDKHKHTCYLMQTSYMLKLNGGDFKQTFAWCNDAGEKYRATCYQSLGRDASGRTSSNIVATKQACLMGENFEQQSNCVIGAVKDFISYFHSMTEAKQLCASFGDTALQKLCRTTGEEYYTLF